MKARSPTGIFLFLWSTAIAQTTYTFDFADAHVTASGRRMSASLIQGRGYEIRNATMVDLIRLAYSLDDNNKVVSGPAWLDSERFEIFAQAPPSTSREELKLMLQSLLSDRFHLVVHRDRKPMPAFVLSQGKSKPKLKPSNGSNPAGCRTQPQNSPPGEIAYTICSCRNTTMEQFAAQWRQFGGIYVTAPMVDRTDLQGAWDFDLKFSPRGQLAAAGADGISLFEAIERQLGLQLGPQKVSANHRRRQRRPDPNGD